MAATACSCTPTAGVVRPLGPPSLMKSSLRALAPGRSGCRCRWGSQGATSGGRAWSVRTRSPRRGRCGAGGSTSLRKKGPCGSRSINLPATCLDRRLRPGVPTAPEAMWVGCSVSSLTRCPHASLHGTQPSTLPTGAAVVRRRTSRERSAPHKPDFGSVRRRKGTGSAPPSTATLAPAAFGPAPIGASEGGSDFLVVALGPAHGNRPLAFIQPAAAGWVKYRPAVGDQRACRGSVGAVR